MIFKTTLKVNIVQKCKGKNKIMNQLLNIIEIK